MTDYVWDDEQGRYREKTAADEYTGPSPEQILPGSIVRYNGLTPDEEGNHRRDDNVWHGMVGQEFVYLGASPEFSNIGFAVIWYPGLGGSPMELRHGGSPFEVLVSELTVIAVPEQVG